MHFDQKNREAVRQGYLLPVEMWINGQPQGARYSYGINLHRRSICRSREEGPKYQSYTESRNCYWSISWVTGRRCGQIGSVCRRKDWRKVRPFLKMLLWHKNMRRKFGENYDWEL